MKHLNLTNSILAASVIGQPEPVVGMPATILHTLDRTPATIVAVERGKGWVVVTVREDNYRAEGEHLGMGHQHWVVVPNPNGPTYTFRFADKAPSWRRVDRNEAGRWVLAGSSNGLRIGEASVYYCWEF